MNVLILTEGGKQYGFGHITRCLALCEAFEDADCRVSWALRSEETDFALLNSVSNIDHFDWVNNHSNAIKLAAKADIGVIDSYFAEQDFLSNLSDLLKQVVFLDDYKRLAYPEGIILNGSPGATKISYNQSWKQ